MSFFDAEPLLNREPRKGMLGMDRRRMRLLVSACWGRRWNVNVGLRRAERVVVVMFVRVNVRMRVGRVGKRM